jgi:hypothetical protein
LRGDRDLRRIEETSALVGRNEIEQDAPRDTGNKVANVLTTRERRHGVEVSLTGSHSGIVRVMSAGPRGVIGLFPGCAATGNGVAFGWFGGRLRQSVSGHKFLLTSLC